jgi:ribosomal protein L37AE/L43A
MPMVDPFVCPKCKGDAEYHGRISAPPHMIYKCGSCGHENWVKQQEQQNPSSAN